MFLEAALAGFSENEFSGFTGVVQVIVDEVLVALELIQVVPILLETVKRQGIAFGHDQTRSHVALRHGLALGLQHGNFTDALLGGDSGGGNAGSARADDHQIVVVSFYVIGVGYVANHHAGLFVQSTHSIV